MIEVNVHEDVFGLIFPAPTGVVYLAEAGGRMLAQMSIEGFFVPLESLIAGVAETNTLAGQSRPDLLLKRCLNQPGLSGEDLANLVDHVLHAGTRPIPVRVDRSRIPDSLEAWFWITHEDAPQSELSLPAGPIQNFSR